MGDIVQNHLIPGVILCQEAIDDFILVIRAWGQTPITIYAGNDLAVQAGRLADFNNLNVVVIPTMKSDSWGLGSDEMLVYSKGE